MKKINFLILLLLICFFNKLKAQIVTKESCTTVTINDKYIQQVVIYADANYTYFTEFEKGKGKNGITSIAKFDKDLKFVSRLMLNEFAVDKVTPEYYGVRILNNNIVLLFSQVANKDDIKYSIAIVNKDFKIIKPLNEVFTTNKEFSNANGVYCSSDSTNLVYVFGKSNNNSNNKLDIEKKVIGIDNTGKINFNKSVKFDNLKEGDNKMVDVVFDNNAIYFEVAIGYSTPTSYTSSSGSSRTLGAYTYGIAKKTEDMKYNFCVYKFNIKTGVNNFFLKDSKLESNYIINSKLDIKNGILYYAGTYSEERYPSDFTWYRYQGHFLIKVDTKTEKVLFSSFELDTEKSNQGIVTNILYKIDGGVYVVVENNNESGVSYSNNLAIYNYNEKGEIVWNKIIKKEHRGGQLFKNYAFLHSLALVKNNDLYIIMNENKKNAELSIGIPMEENKNWEKNVSCILFVYSDNKEKKSIIYNLDDYKCPFYDGYNPFYSIYLTDRKSGLYVNYLQNKIYSIGGVDDERKISVFNIE